MKELVTDELWSFVEPLLPKRRRSRKGGRPRLPDRAVFTGIVYVLKAGIPWEMLPREMGCGSGVTCWRRLRDWQRKGVFDRLHRVLLEHLAEADRLDWSRASLVRGFLIGSARVKSSSTSTSATGTAPTPSTRAMEIPTP